ncbi:MAG: NADH-quinone oxidoreductase subunit L [Calditrichaceae bacterium]|nr:NADH-quinone oxidoreductase subunit L [Calditrichia bacterium]NUQ40783.1 NADH-quinone oxidoreductase subunit L [Calditrichaceae bacterium]
MESFIWVVPLMPLFGALFLGIFGHLLKEKSGIIASLTVLISFIYSVRAFLLVREGVTFDGNLFDWIVAGNFSAGFGVLVDQLSVVMMLVVTGVGFLIHVYSIGYMHGDKGVGRYFSFLNLFIFSMLMLVMGNNLLLLYLGWEGVGLCSYLLIGFWYEKPSAAKAGLKAFLVNRVGDFGFAIGIFIIFTTIGTITYAEIFSRTEQLVAAGVVTTATLLLFMGACGKSAQFPLYIWLPDAMEGPTPVSALIHAATMVTAGVYMVARFNPLFSLSEVSMAVVVIIGLFTALFAATMALVNTDIKRVLAYSTISQLGYMFIGVGVGAYAAGIFHLMTHAFFKALLFLGAGSVMHALANETNIMKMGGLAKKIKYTAWTFILAWLAISGIPPFSGFFSKDEILAKAFAYHPAVWFFGAVGALLTAFYMSRLVFLTFFGKSRVEPEVAHHIHESPYVMTVPLMILGVLSVIGGFVGIPAILGGGNHFEHFLEPVFRPGLENLHGAHLSHAVEYGLVAASVLVALAGIGLAYLMYIKKSISADGLAAKYKGLYTLLYNKYYVDEGIEKALINPILSFSRWLWNFFDEKIIDGLVNLSAKIMLLISLVIRRVQSGYVQSYAGVFVIGVLVILAYYLLA